MIYLAGVVIEEGLSVSIHQVYMSREYNECRETSSALTLTR